MQVSLETQLEELLTTDISSVIERQKSTFERLVANFDKLVVLVGSGLLGRKTLAGLRKLNIRPLAFADNNPALWGKFVEGVGVLSFPDAVDKFGQKATFIVSIYNSSRPTQQLLDLQCKKVVSYAYLFAKYPEVFLPHACLDLPDEMYKQADDVKKAFSLWANDESRQEYITQLRRRLFLDFDRLSTPISQSAREEEYFAKDLFSRLPDEVFVDCGAFDGDTIKRFLVQRNYQFSQIIGLEPDPENFQKLTSYIQTLPDNIKNKIRVVPAAVGAKQERLHFQATNSAASSVSNSGTIEVDVVPLDAVLRDCVPTLIKMDVEGFELDALAGASNLIKEASAVLAITVYHTQDHLWRIPLLIHSLSNEYRFYLRPHAEDCWDVSCYAVPVNRLIE
jgi:FkbM family methyltransferase